jgi:hypothetical protein
MEEDSEILLQNQTYEKGHTAQIIAADQTRRDVLETVLGPLQEGPQVATDLQWTEASEEMIEETEEIGECQAIETEVAKRLAGTAETPDISQENAQSQRKIGEMTETGTEKIISKDHPRGRGWMTLKEALSDKCHHNLSEECQQLILGAADRVTCMKITKSHLVAGTSKT